MAAVRKLNMQSDKSQSKAAIENKLIRDKDKCINGPNEIQESLHQVARRQENGILPYRHNRIKERIRLWFKPRLGVLYHYTPRPIHIPKAYQNAQSRNHYEMDFPVISIVTPSLNHSDFIERTLISVLQQDYPRLEYRVQDGASTDATIAILRKYDNQLQAGPLRRTKGRRMRLISASGKRRVISWHT